MDKCVFCEIVGGKGDREIEFENDQAVVFKSHKPMYKYHFLAVPKKHVSNFMDIEADQDKMLSDLVAALQQAVIKNNLKKAYRLVVNGGANIQVPHLHIHLVAGKVNLKNAFSDMINSVL